MAVIFCILAFVCQYFSLMGTDLLTNSRSQTISTQIELKCKNTKHFFEYFRCYVSCVSPNSFQANMFIGSEEGKNALLDT